MRTVFKLQQPPKKFEASRDYSSLPRNCTVTTILASDLNPSIYPVEAYEKLKNALASSTEGDFILWSGGDPMAALIAGQVLAELGKTGLQWLRWDKKAENGERSRILGSYTAVSIPHKGYPDER